MSGKKKEKKDSYVCCKQETQNAKQKESSLLNLEISMEVEMLYMNTSTYSHNSFSFQKEVQKSHFPNLHLYNYFRLKRMI